MLSFPGYFYDGRIAVKNDVAVELAFDGLQIVDAGGALIEYWPYESLQLTEEVYPDQAARLRSEAMPSGRLIIPDTRFLFEIGGMAPQLAGRNFLGVQRGWQVAGWGIAFFAAVALLVVFMPRFAEPIAAIIPVSWEEAMGDRIVAEAAEEFKPKRAKGAQYCVEPAGRAALDRLTAKLAGTVQTPYTFKIHVIKSAGVNAFAAPGGRMVILEGLLKKSRNADEVAGVLAHEMGHVVARHGTEGIIKALGVAALISAVTGDAASIGATSAELGATLLTLRYSRDAELEADDIGVLILNTSNITAAGLAAFFTRLAIAQARQAKAKAKSKTPSFSLGELFSTHPASAARAAAVKAAGTGTGHAMSNQDWTALRNICSQVQSTP